MSIKKFHEFIAEKFDIKPNKIHALSGILLILENKILLVNPKKFQGLPNKWSIPKGHVEGDLTQLESALKELEEESNISLPEERFVNAPKFTIQYQKSNKVKVLECFVIKIGRKDIPFKLYNDMILRYFLDRNEIAEAGFFSKEEATQLIEEHQKEVLKHLV